jgi:hypothetical protein
MYLAVVGTCAQGAGGAALGLTVADGGGGSEVEGQIEIFSASSANVAFSDFESLTATASGGAGGYSYAWTNFELADDDGVFSVSATGTTNQATYSGLVIAMDTSGDSGGEEHAGSYRIRCTVTDSASATATADYNLNLIGVVE